MDKYLYALGGTGYEYYPRVGPDRHREECLAKQTATIRAELKLKGIVNGKQGRRQPAQNDESRAYTAKYPNGCTVDYLTKTGMIVQHTVRSVFRVFNSGYACNTWCGGRKAMIVAHRIVGINNNER